MIGSCGINFAAIDGNEGRRAPFAAADSRAHAMEPIFARRVRNGDAGIVEAFGCDDAAIKGQLTRVLVTDATDSGSFISTDYFEGAGEVAFKKIESIVLRGRRCSLSACLVDKGGADGNHPVLGNNGISGNIDVLYAVVYCEGGSLSAVDARRIASFICVKGVVRFVGKGDVEAGFRLGGFSARVFISFDVDGDVRFQLDISENEVCLDAWIDPDRAIHLAARREGEGLLAIDNQLSQVVGMGVSLCGVCRRSGVCDVLVVVVNSLDSSFDRDLACICRS